MKRTILLLLALLVAASMAACTDAPHFRLPLIREQEQTQPEASEPEETQPEETQPEETQPEETQPEPTEPEETQPEHSPLYIPGLAVEDVIVYFNEVCLDSEFVNSGDPSKVQKWMVPIYYTVEGEYTSDDLAALERFTQWLNQLEGFPGIYENQDLSICNLQIHFCSRQELADRMGPEYAYMDGAVTFWYDYDEIYDCIICCCTELDQQLRNSVIVEEVYNGLGPVQDTSLRPDSIIYQEFSQPQWLSQEDELILRLLYHPEILPGMDAEECAQVIRRVYY